MKQAVLSHLSADYPWTDRLHCLPETDSSNDRLKELARQGAPHGTAILAGYQTGGHGRMGRSFHSPPGDGVYLSILLRPDCLPQELMHLTCAAAVAMCDAVEQAAGFRPGIKWTNDLVWNRKKLGGILTELGFTPQGRVDWAIIGIGLNCRQEAQAFPPELQQMAASVSMAAGHPVETAPMAAAMLDALARMDRMLPQKDSFLSQYRQDCITVGQQISLLRPGEIRHGTALSVDSTGALVVAFSDGTVETVNSGEVSVRGMYGYV